MTVPMPPLRRSLQQAADAVAVRTQHSIAVAVATVLLLGACASTHGLSASATPIDANALATQRSLAGDVSAPFPTLAWWHAFGDPQLDALITEALSAAPSLQAADARARQAQALAGLADALRKPTLGLGAQYTGVQIPQTMVPPPTGGEFKASTVLMLDFKYAPDLWGGKRAKYAAAIGQARAADADAQAARLTLAANVATAYIGLAHAFDALDVANAEQARSSRLSLLARQRVTAGLDNQSQLHQSEAMVAAARQQAQSAQQQIDSLRNALAALLGQGPDRGLAIERPQLRANSTPMPAVVPSELLGHRADVVAARWRVEAAARGIDASKASFKPSINLNAIIGLAAPNLGDLFGTDALLGFGGPAVSLPIFDGGGLRSQLAKSNADYDLAVAAYNQALVGALREVADALQSMRSLDAQVVAASQARDAAQATWRIANDRLGAGLGNQLSVLVAQQPLLQYDQQLAALRAQRRQAVVDLDRALGGGLDLLPPPSDNTSFNSSAKASTP
ncbi:MAG: efflux transporter outer membrane subunit [Luteimonas sp.]